MNEYRSLSESSVPRQNRCVSYIDYFMCDYARMGAGGMDMRAYNSTEPELIAEEHRFIVRLLKAPIERSS